MDKIRVIAKQVGQSVKVREIENSFETFKEFVGGAIETHDHPKFNDITFYVCRDKQTLGNRASFFLDEDETCLCGNCLIVRQDIENDGESVSLHEDEIPMLIEDLQRRELIRDFSKYEILKTMGILSGMEM